MVMRAPLLAVLTMYYGLVPASEPDEQAQQNSAATDQPTATADAPASETENSTFIDTAHLFLSTKLVNLVDEVDMFFGDERLDHEARGSFMRLALGFVANTDGTLSAINRMRLKADLPRIQEKLNLVFESDEEGSQLDSDPASIGALSGNDGTSTALRFIVRETRKWNVLADAGIRFGNPLDKFVRNRYRRTVTHRTWTLRLSETFFWYDSIGVGETTLLDADSRVGWNNLFRSSSFITWTRNDDILKFGQSFKLFHEIDEARALAMQFQINALSRPKNHVTDYSFGASLRTRTGRRWLFLELNPKLGFDEENNFRATPTLTILMEAIIGGIPVHR